MRQDWKGEHPFGTKRETVKDEEDPDFEENDIPLGVAPQLDILHATLDAVIANNDDSSLTLGVRYDMDAGVALKAEITRFDSDLAEPLFAGQPTLDDGTLFSFGMDIVF